MSMAIVTGLGPMRGGLAPVTDLVPVPMTIGRVSFAVRTVTFSVSVAARGTTVSVQPRGYSVVSVPARYAVEVVD